MTSFSLPFWLTSAVDQDSFTGGAGESATDQFVPVAEEPKQEVSVPTQEAPSRVFTLEEVNEIRRTEKDKLYPEISRLREEVNAMKSAKDEDQARLESERKAAEDEANRKAEDEMEVRELLKVKEQEWQQQLEHERLEREKFQAMLEQERRIAQIQEYRARRVEEERDNILPELVDLIRGETPDQIEESISGLQARSSRILESMQQASDVARRDMAGARVTAPSSDPLDTYSDNRTFTPDQIRDMSIEEFAKHRQSLLGSGQSASGLFG